ncbi:MAG: DUF885 domain-containing protein [Gammaproteobacteria bacterium]|nr:DUF885 domain-containing protein [Gammaproteobacteria bacterium]MDH5261277.1 DUF885 domain-containing protein [Gammaproteobacteria bacterium]MDH5583225.1 DUF885 domain-containing protein [Gammaproteobacteria bacterium]
MARIASIRFPRIALVLFAALLFAACDAKTPAVEELPVASTQRNIETIADEILAAMLERYPSMATSYSIAGARHDRLYDNSLEALAEWQAREDAWLAELDAIGEPAEIGSRDWVSFGILREQLAASQASRVCRKELWETSTTTAWYTGMPFIFDIQPLESDDLKEQALARLSAVDKYIDTNVANLKKGLELGYSSPRLTVEAVPEEVRALRDENSPFLAIGARVEDEVFDGKVKAIFADEIVPAINRYANFIENEYLDKAREEIALSHNPDGAECYPTLVRDFATIQPSADEIHELGLAQMAKIRVEMQEILAANYEGEAVEKFLRRINVDPEFTFRSEDDVLQYSLDSLDRARDKMPEVFGLLPRAAVEIKPYPAFAESGVGEYHSSSEDGTRPGIFYIAVRNPENRSRATQQSTLFHETYPGHHLQGAIALELGDKVHPLARYLWNSGYGEGWALYSERVAQELGLYSGPLDLMGLLSDQAARAARLVIDSGIHTKGWTRQQAVDYMLNNTGWAPVDIENDINRYISWPGQANAYMLGMLEIRRLRKLAEVELGEQFDIRDFHDRILENGSMTLPMTEKAVLAWIEKTKQE